MKVAAELYKLTESIKTMKSNHQFKPEGFGSLFFQSFAQFEDPYHGLSKEERFEKQMEKYMTFDIPTPASPPTSNTAGWPIITNAIKRNATYSIESKTSNESYFVKFDPHNLESSYFIVNKPHEIRQGFIQRIIPENDKRLSMLTNYNQKFCLLGADQDRPHLKFIWKIGLHQIKELQDFDAVV